MNPMIIVACLALACGAQASQGWAGPPANIALSQDGRNILDTPEVAQARAAHLSALNQAAQNNPNPQDDGSYNPQWDNEEYWQKADQNKWNAAPAHNQWNAAPAQNQWNAAPAHNQWNSGAPAPVAESAQGAQQWNAAPAQNQWNAAPAHNQWNAAPAHNQWDSSSQWNGAPSWQGGNPAQQPANIRLANDGSGILDTPEVAAARAAHLQAHAQVAHAAPAHAPQQRWKDQLSHNTKRDFQDQKGNTPNFLVKNCGIIYKRLLCMGFDTSGSENLLGVKGFFIQNVYAKWRMSPMIVSINPKNIELEELPFPAITICNMNQAKKSVALRYLEEGNHVDKKLLRHLCSSREDSSRFEDDIAGSADWDHTRQFLINITQPCNEMIAQCIWASSTVNCEDLFNAQLTDEGLCCTFNAVHRNNMFRNPRSVNDLNLTFPSPAVDWTPEDGYPADAPPDGFPWRPKGVGTQNGLSLVLDANIDEYYCASTKSAGFKILMHNPVETPKLRNLGEIYAPGIEGRISICPEISDSRSSLRTIDIKKRLCLFSSEKELVFFRTYTLKNCQMECEARAMLDVCRCVYYYMPKNKTTPICGKSDAKCYANMSKIIPGQDTSCKECLPACNELAYSERFSWAPLKNSLVAKLAQNLGNRTQEYFTEHRRPARTVPWFQYNEPSGTDLLSEPKSIVHDDPAACKIPICKIT
ncbi:unnamed protein product [Arctia plantaginis]|uniref:Uncharacterized protein n=1 Tax=Arctia plantaginis TaxID=874455 RepID=A0A8S0YN68_ARCPL|nr:unnamed protein product [Arctia plantaginis]CAB3246276.1 unnamed protein product [Arctia plantaginis]